jgi:hypothetical protein
MPNDGAGGSLLLRAIVLWRAATGRAPCRPKLASWRLANGHLRASSARPSDLATGASRF